VNPKDTIDRRSTTVQTVDPLGASAGSATLGALSERAPRRRSIWRAGLGRFIIKRLILIPISLFGIIVLSFLLVALIPASTAQAIAGDGATKAQIAAINHTLGLDQPLWQQFVSYLVRLGHLDLGTSFYSRLPVMQDIATRLPISLEIGIPAFILSVVFGIAIGSSAAFYPRRFPDFFERGWSTVLHAIPEFLLGVVGIYVVFFLLRLVPAPTGQTAIGDPMPKTVTGFLVIDSLIGGDLQTFEDVLARMALPTLVLALHGTVIFARITRSGMSDALHSPFIEYARAVGLPRHQILRYGLLAIRTTLMTYIALGMTALIGGAAIIETLFSWPGLGAWGISGMTNIDPPVIQGFVLVTGLFSLLLFLLLDLATVLLDPRVSIDNGH
jgi:peptide/nickel transport system permease protein